MVDARIGENVSDASSPCFPSARARLATVAALTAIGLLTFQWTGPATAQSTSCPEAITRAQPMANDTARGSINRGEGFAAWKIDGAVGRVDVHLTGLKADLDLFVCGPDAQITGNSISEGASPEHVSMTVEGPADYTAVVFANPGREGNGTYELTVERPSAAARPGADVETRPGHDDSRPSLQRGLVTGWH